MDHIWTSVKARLKGTIADHSYRMWIEPIRFCDEKDDAFVLACPNSFSRKRIADHYKGLIEEALLTVVGRALRLKLVVGESCDPSEPLHDRQMKLPAMDAPLNSGRLLRKEFTFDQFVVGKNSDFAYSAALSLASRNRGMQNALFLHSKTGLGKSHLSQAVGHHILKTFPSERVYYITAEDFMNEMTDAYRGNRIHQFKEKYRQNCDVLLIEDVHFLSGKNGTQEELSNTLESLMNANKKIIYSSCCLPSDIPKLHEKLKSRLCCGLISKIDAPDYKTRLRILEQSALGDGLGISKDVLQYLASELTEDVRQLKSGLIGVAARASLLCANADLSLARSVVDDISTTREGITLETIKRLVCKYYKVTLDDLTSRSRRQAIVKPRQVAMYLSRRYTDHSLQTIGKSFNRYHATTMHALKAVEKNVRENGPLQKQVAFLSQRLEKGNL